LLLAKVKAVDQDLDSEELRKYGEGVET
jgi:hypothetical protein